jgi:ABC-2 type transport system ATP-binding protein
VPDDAPPRHLVEVDDLVVRYGSFTAVAGISFTAAAGEVLAVLGPNGAGKTSTVETLEGYRRPSGGRVRVCGLDPVADHRRLVGRLGVMLQDGGVPSALRVGEAVALYAAYYPDPHNPAELVERVGLADRARTPWRSLSGGERQRLSLALALVGRPAVAFLDEPTAGIDPAGRQVVRELVAEVAATGTGVVLTTHDLADAQRLADRILVLAAGRIVAAGTTAELTAGTGESFTFGAAANLDTSALGQALGCPVTEGHGGTYLVAGAPDPQRVAALTTWLAERHEPLGALTTGRTLEDVYLELTAGSDPAGNEPPADDVAGASS